MEHITREMRLNILLLGFSFYRYHLIHFSCMVHVATTGIMDYLNRYRRDRDTYPEEEAFDEKYKAI